MIRKRAGWLCALFLGEMLTASAMQHFEGELEKAIVLTLFIPLIMSSGGSPVRRRPSLIIRALALGELKLSDWWRVLLRELPTGMVLGAILGLVGVARIALWQNIGLFDYGEHWVLVGFTDLYRADRHRDRWFDLRLDAAFHPAEAAASIRPVASAPFVATLGRRERTGDLLLGRGADPQRDATLSMKTGPDPPRFYFGPGQLQWSMRFDAADGEIRADIGDIRQGQQRRPSAAAHRPRGLRPRPRPGNRPCPRSGNTETISGMASSAACWASRIFPAVMGDLEFDKDSQAETDLLAVDIGAVAADDAGLFEVADAAQAGRWRQVDLLGDLDVGGARILLQAFQDGQIEIIQIWHDR